LLLISNQSAEQSLANEENEYEGQLLLRLARENAALRRQVQILESIPDLAVAFNLDGPIYFASQSALDFLGLSCPEDIQGASFWDLVTYKSRILIQRELEEALNVHEEGGSESTALAGGSTLMVYVVIKEQGCDEESHLVSLKGVVHTNEGGEHTCICSIRLATRALHRVDSCTVISVASRD
jgi:PAS domain S-box-containing protein